MSADPVKHNEKSLRTKREEKAPKRKRSYASKNPQISTKSHTDQELSIFLLGNKH